MLTVSEVEFLECMCVDDSPNNVKRLHVH